MKLIKMIRISIHNRCCMCRGNGEFMGSGFWYPMGHARLCGGVVILLESLAWDSYFRYFEFDSRLFDVDCMDGMKSSFL